MRIDIVINVLLHRPVSLSVLYVPVTSSYAARHNSDHCFIYCTGKSASSSVAPKKLTKFSLYDNVIAKWTDNKWYSAQIYRVLGDGRYSVYFIDDNEVLDVTKKQMKKPGKKMVWAKITRTSCLTMEFIHTPTSEDDERPKGRYYVQGLGEGDDVNKFMCTFKKGRQGNTKTYMFNIGYVHNILVVDVFPHLKHPNMNK